MHFAARLGDMLILQLLLTNNAKLDISDEKHESPLYKAASRGYVEIVSLSKENGSNTEIRNSDGAITLSNAIEGGRESVVRFLLKHIDKENLRDPESAFLHAAVRVANSNIVMLLFDSDIGVSRVLPSRWDSFWLWTRRLDSQKCHFGSFYYDKRQNTWPPP